MPSPEQYNGIPSELVRDRYRPTHSKSLEYVEKNHVLRAILAELKGLRNDLRQDRLLRDMRELGVENAKKPPGFPGGGRLD